MEIIECKSKNGSIKNYYHFFYCCLIPLIYFHIHNLNTSILFISSIGKMKYLLNNLTFSVQIKYLNNYNKTENLSNILLLKSYDTYDSKYDQNNNLIPRISYNMRNEIISYFNNNMKSSSYQKDRYKDINNSYRMITLIERDVPTTITSSSTSTTTMQSNNTSILTTGYSRRHIKNHLQLKQELSNYYGNLFQNIYLERLSLSEQYEIFQSSSIIIAQHGAALSNIFFMLSKCSSNNQLSHIIEISPPYSRKAKYFYNLANSFNISYSSIYQHRNKGNVSIPEIIQHIDCILINWKYYLNEKIDCHYQDLGKICGNFIDTI